MRLPIMELLVGNRTFCPGVAKGIVLSMAGAVLHIFAKIHYFTRIGVTSTHKYFIEYSPYTLGVVGRRRNHLD